MKRINSKILAVAFGALLLQGCVAFPPLVQVEHKHEAPPRDEETLRRLEAIDQRLERLEKTQTQQQ